MATRIRRSLCSSFGLTLIVANMIGCDGSDNTTTYDGFMYNPEVVVDPHNETGGQNTDLTNTPQLSIALKGSDNHDVNTLDPYSVTLGHHGDKVAKPTSVQVFDVDGDGHLDAVATFDTREIMKNKPLVVQLQGRGRNNSYRFTHTLNAHDPNGFCGFLFESEEKQQAKTPYGYRCYIFSSAEANNGLSMRMGQRIEFVNSLAATKGYHTRVPTNGLYTVEAYGARGGQGNPNPGHVLGGLGGYAAYATTAEHHLTFYVGVDGCSTGSSSHIGGGGGGTTIVRKNASGSLNQLSVNPQGIRTVDTLKVNRVLLIAGGGGGAPAIGSGNKAAQQLDFVGAGGVVGFSSAVDNPVAFPQIIPDKMASGGPSDEAVSQLLKTHAINGLNEGDYRGGDCEDDFSGICGDGGDSGRNINAGDTGIGAQGGLVPSGTSGCETQSNNLWVNIPGSDLDYMGTGGAVAGTRGGGGAGFGSGSSGGQLGAPFPFGGKFATEVSSGGGGGGTYQHETRLESLEQLDTARRLIVGGDVPLGYHNVACSTQDSAEAECITNTLDESGLSEENKYIYWKAGVVVTIDMRDVTGQ